MWTSCLYISKQYLDRVHGSLYWRFEEAVKSLESASGSVMGADGSIFAIRRKLHVRPPPDLIDDMYVSLSILCRGARIVRVPDAIAHEEAVSRSREEFRRKVRIACQAFNVHRALRPHFEGLGMLDRYKYLSHKLLRWMTAYLLLGSFLCILTGLCFTRQWIWPVAFLLGVGTGLCGIGDPGGPAWTRFAKYSWHSWRQPSGSVVPSVASAFDLRILPPLPQFRVSRALGQRRVTPMRVALIDPSLLPPK